MAKDYSLSRQDFVQLLQDPTFGKQYAEGYLKGQALAQTVGETPMQPEVTAAAIQPEPQYIEPASTTYTGFKDEPMPDMPPQMAMAPDMPPQVPMQPSVFDEMQSAKSPKEQQRLLFKLMSQSMEQQQAGVRQAQEALKKEQERQAGLGVLGRLDLRPFTEALRSYGSTSVAQAQAPEMTEAQRQEFLRRLQAQVQGAQEGMTKEQVLAMRTMMQDKAGAQAALSQKNYEKRLFDTAKTDYMKPANEYIKATGQYNFVKNEIATGQPTRINRALAQYARIMGHTGVLAEGDIRLQITPTARAAIDRAYTFVTGNPEVELPEDIVKDLIASLDEGNRSLKDAYKTKIDTVHSMYLSSPSYATMPGLEGLYKSALKPAEAQAGEMPVGLPSAASIKAERERRAKEKQSKPKGK